MMNRFIELLALVLFLLLSSNGMSDAGRQSVGVVKGEGVIHVDSRGTAYEASVSVVIADDGRFIFEIGNHWNFKDKRILFSFDGEDFYYFVSGGHDHGDLAYLSSGEIPINLFQDCARDALWYAVGNGSFLRKNGAEGEIVNLYQTPRSSINAYGFRYESELIDQSPLMGRSFFIYKDRGLDMGSLEEEASRLSIDPDALFVDLERLDRQWLIKQDATDDSLSVSVIWDDEVILESGHILPASFTSLAYPVYHPSDNPPAWTIKAMFSSWRYDADFIGVFRPEITSRTRVYDSRLRVRTESHFASHVLYWLRPGGENWRPRDHPQLKHSYEEELIGNELAEYGSRSRVSGVVLVFIVILIGIAPVIMIWRNKVSGS